MTIELPKEVRAEAVASIERYFRENTDERIGNIAASGLLAFLLEEIGPSIYNKAVSDVQERLQQRVTEVASRSTRKSSSTGASSRSRQRVGPDVGGTFAAYFECQTTRRRQQLMPSPTLRELTQRFHLAGRVEAIYLRPARLAPVVSVSEARAEPGQGLIGDRRSSSVHTGDLAQKREVTLFQSEHLPTLAAWLGLPTLDASRLRRNLVVSGLNLVSMRSIFADVARQWRIGAEVVLEVTGNCDPCSRMETELGEGGYNAMRGHGGVTARILTGGAIRVADPIRLHVTRA